MLQLAVVISLDGDKYIDILNVSFLYRMNHIRLENKFGTYVLSGGPLIYLEKKVCILDTFLRESCIYFYL